MNLTQKLKFVPIKNLIISTIIHPYFLINDIVIPIIIIKKKWSI